MAKRFTEQVGIRPVDIRSGAAEGMRDLSARLSEFKHSVSRTQSAIGVRRGMEEAADVEIQTVDGQVIPPNKKKTGLTDILLTNGMESRTYNKIVHEGYLSSLKNDIRNDVASIELDNESDLGKFNTVIEGLKKGVMEGVDPAARQEASIFFDNQIASSRLRVQRNTQNKAARQAADEIISSVDNAGNQAARNARLGDMKASAASLLDAFAGIDSLVETGEIDKSSGIKKKRAIEREATEQSLRFKLDTTADTKGIDAASNDLEKMRNKVPSGWTPDEWDVFVASARTSLNGKRVRLLKDSAQGSLDLSREVSDLQIQAKTGTGDPGNIFKRTEELFDLGVINVSTRTSILTNVVNGQKKSEQDAEIMQRVSDRLSGNPGTVVSQSDIDQVYEKTLSRELSEADPIKRNASIAEFVDSTKIVPSKVETKINSYLNSMDPALISEASDLIDRLDNVRGIPEDIFTPNERAFAKAVVSLQDNMHPEEAILLAKQNTNPNDASRVEVRVKEITDNNLDLRYQDWVDDEFNPFFAGSRVDAVNRSKLTKEFSALFEEHYKAGMSERQAKETAFKIMSRNWGTTSVIGAPRAIKYPPEQYYTVGSNSEYIGKQLFADIQKDFMFDRPLSKDMVLIVSDKETARSASSGEPNYSVILDLGDDGLLPLMGVRWQPDVQSEIERQNKEAESTVLKEREKAKVISGAINRMELRRGLK